MLHEVVEETDPEPAALQAAYEERIREAVVAVGVETVVDETKLDRETVTALADGESSELTVEEAAAVLALDSDRDAETIVLELRDHLLMGMTTAVLDVDSIAANVDLDLTGQEVQQALEGRNRMTLAELAEIHSVIESRKR